MDFHTCANCYLINQAVGKQIKKFDTLSKENVGFHNTLIKSKDTIIEMESEITNLCDGLIAERQRKLQMYLQQQTSDLQQQSQACMQLVANTKFKEWHRNKYGTKRRTESVSALTNNKTDFISLAKYNELRSLMDKQKRMHETDLDFFRSLSDKCNDKLKQQIASMHEHMSIMLETCETSQIDLYKERKENVEYREFLEHAFETINNEHYKQLDVYKKKMMTEATNTANARVREAVSSMKTQLAKRVKLVGTLQTQSMIIEICMQEQEQDFCKQQSDHKQAIGELQKELRNTERKYRMLKLRRSLEGEGFRTDVTNICKEIKQVKNKLCSAERNCKIYPDIQKLEERVDDMDRRVQSVYSS